MTRAIFEKDQLSQFLEKCKHATKLSLPQLAKRISVERHTLNDWRRERLLPSLEKLTELSAFAHIPLPRILETKTEHWASSAAAFHKNQLYGCNLTHADRVKAGTNSQQRRRENPEYYSALGCNVAHTFALPINPSIELAELVGILLGDGGIRGSQFTITLNSIADDSYSHYVVSLIDGLFTYKPTVAKRPNCNALTITTSGVEIVKYLLKIGLHTGDKVRQQVGVPEWVKTSPEYSRWCLRGLMDTDGGIFTNSYIINGKSYVYPKTNFTNASQPLIDFVYETLRNNGFHPNNRQPRKIWLYSQVESRRYLEVIGSSNERLLKKIR